MKKQSFTWLCIATVFLFSFGFVIPSSADGIPGTFVPNGQNLYQYVQQTTLGDLDNDGDLDVLLGIYYSAGRWYRNNGDATFSLGGNISGVPNHANTVELADFNGDGILDMMVGGYNALTVRLNDGTGYPSSVISLPIYGTPRALIPGDFDSDGDVDVMVGGDSIGLIFLNDGSASFTPVSQPHLRTADEHTVAVGDVDNDGDLDISLLTRILLNNGLGYFTDSGQSIQIDRSWGRSFGDIDRDGDLDLAIADAFGPLKVLFNDANGMFLDSGQSLGSGTEAYGADFADIDRDGDLDMVVQSYDSYVYYNDGTGFFELGQIIPGGQGSSHSGLGDLNGDLYPDFAQATVEGARIFIFHPSNQPPTANAGGPYTVSEGTFLTLDASGSSDPENGLLTFEWDLDNDSEYDDAVGIDSEVTFYDNGIYTTGLKATDEYNKFDTDTAEIAVVNVAPIVGDVTAPTDPVQVGTAFNISAPFSDPGRDTWGVSWDWGDGTVSPGGVTNFMASGSHTYNTPGVYTITLEVTDDDGGSGKSIFQYIVAYDPNGGFVTGGGWINSPLGAYTSDPSLTGQANFGFISRYQKGATIPTGQTEFQFHLANLNFKSTSYDWLVISGTKAQYKGSGTINREGNYGFLLTALDGVPDKFRLKIWDKDTGEIIYDNINGAMDNTNPTTALGGGSIVIHK